MTISYRVSLSQEFVHIDGTGVSTLFEVVEAAMAA